MKHRSVKNYLRAFATLGGLLLAWQVLVWVFRPPPFILPGPDAVFVAWIEHAALLGRHTLVTAVEIIAGLVLGAALGLASALLMLRFAGARRWLLPVLVVSQALPVFALAPVLMLYLGYGMVSKIAMAVLIIYFPVAAAGYDGLRRTRHEWIALAATMNGDRAAVLRHIRLPAALPSIASGLRIAAAVAPIGAVVGEWVGSAAGLGFLMLHASGRMTIDLMFAALLTLALLAVTVYFAVDALLKRLLYWQP